VLQSDAKVLVKFKRVGKLRFGAADVHVRQLTVLPSGRVEIFNSQTP